VLVNRRCAFVSLRRPALAALVLTGVTSAQLAAHAGEPLAPHDLPWAWSTDPFVLVPLLLSAVLYRRGLTRIRQSDRAADAVTPRQVRAFVGGWIAMVVALVSPLDAMGGVLFSAHMAQHEVLMLIAAPLLVYARPVVPLLFGLPRGWARLGAPVLRQRALQGAWGVVASPFNAWALHGVAIWVWHAPALFQATITNELVHALQHISFFGSAVLFWWACLHVARGRGRYGAAFFYVFTTAVHTTILGALLTVSPRAWYPAYAATAPAWGLTALEDQQLGGLIMWVPAGIAYAVSGLMLFLELLAPADAARGDARLGPMRGPAS
jgi:putative membrane protein